MVNEMESNRTKGLMVAAIIVLALVFVLALTLTIVLLDKDGQDSAEAGSLRDRLDRLEQKLDAPAQVVIDDDHMGADYADDQAKEEKHDGGNDVDQGKTDGNGNQGQQPTDNDQQVIEALGYNYASSERPDLNWQVTDSNVNGDDAEVTLTAQYAQGMETRTYNFKKQNGVWVFDGGGSGSAQAPPSP
jgi:hypothetical protein